ncbi:MAG: MipA/OmpV family protein [Novosphingobium sp.]|uniref:MipA/OmpV family protein n=1 Tax=Novosphingobium sp. TaxID=1874826 RepID=UPI0032B82976
MPRLALYLTAPFGAMLGIAQPALAQDARPVGPPPAGDRVTIGLGLGTSADYEGSDDYRLQPGGILQGRLGGIDFQMRGLNLYTDLIADKPGSRTQFKLGPVVQVRLDRTGTIKDPRVAQLGSRKTAVELGLNAGIGLRGALIPPDSLSFEVSYLHDVAGAHRSAVVTPSINYATPVSARAFARLSVSADHVGAGYARTYFDVAPVAGPAVPLPAYATRGAGWKSVGTTLLYTRDLGGEPRKGLGLFALAGYKRLLGQFADSPIVRDAGSASQGLGVIGLSYSF